MVDSELPRLMTATNYCFIKTYYYYIVHHESPPIDICAVAGPTAPAGPEQRGVRPHPDITIVLLLVVIVVVVVVVIRGWCCSCVVVVVVAGILLPQRFFDRDFPNHRDSVARRWSRGTADRSS